MQPTSPSQREALEEAVTIYHRAVSHDVAAVEYLIGRGLTKETVDTFRLGVVSDAQPGHGRQVGKLAIPYLHPKGYPLTVRFRCFEDHDHREYGHGKYMSLPDDPARMFNVPAIHEAESVIHVTEGEFDAIMLTQLGYHAVAIPGANNWKPRHRVMLSGFSRVWVWGDRDDAGAEFVNKVTRSLRQARGVQLPHGDVSDVYLTEGADAIQEIVESHEAKLMNHMNKENS
jgi:DNA primase